MIPPFGLIDATRSVAELAAMRRMLDASRGCSSFSIVTCNSPALRDWVIGELQRDHGGIEVVSIATGVVDVFGHVVSSASDANRSSLFVVDLEKALPSSDVEHLPLRSLNASRELWSKRFPCPTVFWVPEYVATLIPQHARDLARYVSHRFEFVSDRASAIAGMSESLARDLNVGISLPAEEKRSRITELEQRIDSAGTPPAPELLPHVRSWMTEVGLLHFLLDDYDRAEGVFRRAIDLDEQFGDRALAPLLRGVIGLIYQRRGNPKRAEALIHEALAIDVGIGARATAANNLRTLGTVLAARGDLEAAEAMIRNAIAIDEELGARAAMAIDLGYLGMVLAARGDLEPAEATIRKAITIDDELGTRATMAINLCNLGRVLAARGDLEAAEATIRKAITIDEELGARVTMGFHLVNLGFVLSARGDLEAAEATIRKAIAIDEELGVRSAMAVHCSMLGLVYASRGDLDQAREIQEKALDIAQQLGDREGMARIYLGLGFVSQLRGDRVLAHERLANSRDLFAQLDMRTEVALVQRLLDSPKQGGATDASVPFPGEHAQANVNDPQGPRPVADDRGNQDNSNGGGSTG